MHGKSIYNVLTIEHSIGHGVFYRKKTSNVMFEVGIYFPICWFFFVQNEKINNEHNNKNEKKIFLAIIYLPFTIICFAWLMIDTLNIKPSSPFPILFVKNTVHVFQNRCNLTASFEQNFVDLFFTNIWEK